MKYRNIKTGQTIEVPSKISGVNWELVGGKPVMETATVSISDDKDKPVKRQRKTKKIEEGQ
jgi:hypothetical protein